MDDLPDDSPAARAAHRLVTLIRACEGVGDDSAGFDPWPVALAEARMHAATDEGESAIQAAVLAWRPLHEAAKAAEASYSGPLLRSPELKRMAALNCIDNHREHVLAGDGGAVLDAIAACASHGVVIPAWLAAEFVTRQQRVVRGLCKDWSDPSAFGRYHDEGANAAGIRAATIFGPWAYQVACELLERDPSRALSRDGLYDEVGERIKRSHSQAFALIRDHVASTSEVNPPLDYVRSGLAQGLTLGQVFSRFGTERYDAWLLARGYRPGADGVWRAIDDPEN